MAPGASLKSSPHLWYIDYKLCFSCAANFFLDMWNKQLMGRAHLVIAFDFFSFYQRPLNILGPGHVPLLVPLLRHASDYTDYESLLPKIAVGHSRFVNPLKGSIVKRCFFGFQMELQHFPCDRIIFHRCLCIIFPFLSIWHRVCVLFYQNLQTEK